MSRRAIQACIGLAAVLSVFAFSSPAIAGACRPLCRTFDIGEARSLPWGNEWSSARTDYNVNNLVADTEALLAPSTPVIVRMETIRRASIYAGRDRQVAERLFTRLMDRANASEKAGRPDALAFFDAAYAAISFYQIGEFAIPTEVQHLTPNVKGIVRDVDAYALVKKSLALRDDGAVHYGAELIASVKPETRQFCAEHNRKARTAAAGNVLLARNLMPVS
jgi:hypothetical protein